MSGKHSNISVFVPHLGCPQRCTFCNQHHIARTQQAPAPSDVDAAVQTAVNSRNYDPKITEIAFFGGSFTAIEREYMLSLLRVADKYVKNGTVSGIRVSTRPDAINDDVLEVLKSHGVTTVELGAQSMDDTVLALNKRGHTSADVSAASRLIKKSGIALGLQMMTGLYGSSDEKDVYTAEQISLLLPDCVRIYPTVTLENTALAEYYKKGEYAPPTLDSTVRLCVKIKKIFDECGIPVIRLGLHTIDEDAYVAGPWHPAFSELCDSLVFREKIFAQLGDAGEYSVFVNPRDISKAVGQLKSNIEYFKTLGFNIRVSADDSLQKNSCNVKRK